MKKPEYIFIHHTAVSYNKNSNQWKATDAYHKKQGWGGGGYNYEIAKDGSVHQFRKDGTQTAAQYQNNMNDGRAISICLDGNFDIEDPTPEQYQACQKLILDKVKEHGIRPENINPHRSVATYKSCPGKRMPNNLATFFAIVPIKKENPVQQLPEKPIGTAEKRAAVIARIAQRSRVIQKVINIFSKER